TPKQTAAHLLHKALPIGELLTGDNEEAEPESKSSADDLPSLDTLIENIKATVEPCSWAGHGGVGPIDYTAGCQHLVVARTKEVLEEVETMLDAMAAAKKEKGAAGYVQFLDDCHKKAEQE